LHATGSRSIRIGDVGRFDSATKWVCPSFISVRATARLPSKPRRMSVVRRRRGAYSLGSVIASWYPSPL
jgi:hypothetical protein